MICFNAKIISLQDLIQNYLHFKPKLCKKHFDEIFCDRDSYTIVRFFQAVKRGRGRGKEVDGLKPSRKTKIFCRRPLAKSIYEWPLKLLVIILFQEAWQVGYGQLGKQCVWCYPLLKIFLHILTKRIRLFFL